jgi:hypothetical protein
MVRGSQKIRKAVKHICPAPIVHTVDRPVDIVVYKTRTGLAWYALLVGLLIGYAIAMFIIKKNDPIQYPVYINRIDPSLQAKLSECQADWQADQITKKLLQTKIKRLELP